MNESQAILGAWAKARECGETAILATVVEVRGSAYRRPGARLLLTQDGWKAGSVSGGCLESDIAKRAWWLTADSQPALVTYDTSDDEAIDDRTSGVGLGCNGVVRILLERLEGREKFGGRVHPLAEALRATQAGVLATIYAVRGSAPATRVGERLLRNEDGTHVNGIANADLARRVRADADTVFGENRSMTQTYDLGRGGQADVFLEVFAPPIPLVVIGAGHDAIPLVTLAKALGWHVTVVDNRPAYATQGRFPDADVVVVCPPEGVGDRVTLGPTTAVLVMTHNYGSDLRLLRTLLPVPLRYLGVLGPKKRTDELLRDLQHGDTPITLTSAQRARLYAPVGLDIGADTPQTVALAIVAEIQAVLAGRNGGLLRDRRAPIHDEDDAVLIPSETAPPYGKAACALSAW